MDPVTLALIAGAIAAGSTVGKIFFENKAATSQKENIDLQMGENHLQHQQKTLANYDAMQNLLDTQEAQLTTRGVKSSSPSFGAIQRNTINIGAKEQKNLDIEESLTDYNLRTEKKNVNDQLFASIFGDVANFGESAASLAGKTPTKTNFAPVEEGVPSWSRG